MNNYITELVDFMKYLLEKHGLKGLVVLTICIITIAFFVQLPQIITAVRWW